jgi:tetratricopeptide (TPR) repeat protein
MPVIGHALVGFATGLYTPSSTSSQPTRTGDRDAWVLLMVLLAYLPDIAAQVLQLAGVAQVSRLSHSLGFILVAAPLAGLAAAAVRLARPGYAIALAAFSISLHIGLDVLQGTDRAVLWPLTSRRLSLGLTLIPASMPGELALIGLALGTAAFAVRGRWRPARPGRWSAIGALLVLGLAVTTYVLRDRREHDLRTAKWLLEDRHEYAAALDLLGRADRWPSPARPGRVDYLRAEAYDRLGDRARAERHYLESFDADPFYFWTVADLALFYASGPGPADVRRRAAAPYVERLVGRFPRHRETAATLRRIERLLGAPAP